MKVKGNATALSESATGFTGATAVWVFNPDPGVGQIITVRNAADDADIGTISVPASSGIIIDLDIGQGLRGVPALLGTHIASSGV